MKVLRFTQFITEKLGVSEETLKYSNLMLDFIFNEFYKFLDSTLKNYENSTTLQSTEDIPADKYALDTIELKVSFTRVSREEFSKKYPVLSSRGKYYVTTGLCDDVHTDDFGKSTVAIEIGGIIDESRFTQKEEMKLELESTILHELNHSFESYNRERQGNEIIPTALTFALDINAAEVPDDVWHIWWKEFAYFIYWAERHEINAMIQETLPYIKRYSLGELKKKAPSWDFSERMMDFSPEKFKANLVEKIRQFMPGRNPNEVMEEMKTGLAKSLRQLLSEPGYSQKSTISPRLIEKLTVHEFIEYCDRIIKKGAKTLQRGIMRLYSRK